MCDGCFTKLTAQAAGGKFEWISFVSLHIDIEPSSPTQRFRPGDSSESDGDESTTLSTPTPVSRLKGDER